MAVIVMSIVAMTRFPLVRGIVVGRVIVIVRVIGVIVRMHT